MSVIGNPKTVTVGGIRYYVEALDMDRLHSNLALISEEAIDLRLHAVRNPDDPEWISKADKADQDAQELREMIKLKREYDANN